MLERVATYTTILDFDGNLIDRGLVLRFAAPRSFTGEDMIEFQMTGSRAVVSATLRALGSFAAVRPAEAGEFAKRAYENGKIDLIQVEGLASVVEAETAAQLRHANTMVQGAISRQCEACRYSLLEALASVEALLDFSDAEDAVGLSANLIYPFVEQARSALVDLLGHDRITARLRDGVTIVIGGAPNVGKSTLLNHLAKRDVAIVSPIPGTTRDTLEVAAEISGFPVIFVDTAGIRETTESIEIMGIERARRRFDSADLILWLTDGDDPISKNLPGRCTLRVRTKCDLLADVVDRPGEIAISAETGFGVENLISKIATHVEDIFAGSECLVLGTERQRAAARDALAILDRVLASRDLAEEVVAEDLRAANATISRLTGHIGVEEVLGQIFARLCIGK